MDWELILGSLAIIGVLTISSIALTGTLKYYKEPEYEVIYIDSLGKWAVKKSNGNRFLTGKNKFGSYDNALRFDTKEEAEEEIVLFV